MSEAHHQRIGQQPLHRTLIDTRTLAQKYRRRMYILEEMEEKLDAIKKYLLLHTISDFIRVFLFTYDLVQNSVPLY